MAKVRLNENEEIVKRVKEGLKQKGGYCPCRIGNWRKTNACAKNSVIRLQTRNLRDTATACCIIRKSKGTGKNGIEEERTEEMQEYL